MKRIMMSAIVVLLAFIPLESAAGPLRDSGDLSGLPAPPAAGDFQKGVFVDKGDHYYLNTGEKASFVRYEHRFAILPERDGSLSAALSETIGSRFHGRIELTREQPFEDALVFDILEAGRERELLGDLAAVDGAIAFISPLLKSLQGGGEIALSPSIVVRLADDTDRDAVMAALKEDRLSPAAELVYTDREVEMRIVEPVEDIGRIFELARTLAARPDVQWAEPNFTVKIESQFTPNDTLYGDLWHLHNTGQNGAVPDADIDAPEGWDLDQGSGAVIAIFDDGVDLAHEDLLIWSNPGETGGGKESNGIDDDGNGFVDDHQGWDFQDGDNDPGPATINDNHGTACAGIAGAIGDNGLGCAGSALGASILPIRMAAGTCAGLGNAMRYAGKYADVVSASWILSACQSELNAALADVVHGNIPGSRRGSKGTPVFFSTGNNASGWLKLTIPVPYTAGTYDFRWRFYKDGSDTGGIGYDTAWLDDITWPGGGTTDFESDTPGSVPAGFTSGGDADWAVVSDGVHARGGSGNSVRAGTISHNGETWLDITRTIGDGQLSFWVWVSSEQGHDPLEYWVDGTRILFYYPGSSGHYNEVQFPASNADTIAVGASNDGGLGGFEERSYYSQFGAALDIVAPSDGGGQGIITTDRMGAAGYPWAPGDGNYLHDFGGTSAATPLAAGIGATMIMHDPELTAAEVRALLRSEADEIGPYPYTSKSGGRRNDHYGYGRANIHTSLQGVEANLVILVSFTALGTGQGVRVEWETASEIDTEGFRLWRAEGENGEYSAITENLIPAGGGPAQGAAYTFDDGGLQAGELYYYLLEDIDIYGNGSFHGPVTATAGAPCGASGASTSIPGMLWIITMAVSVLFILTLRRK